MSRLFIRLLKITIATDNGNFGCVIPFTDGLNIIRAENSSGKSTCLNAIVYALGLEEIFGKSGTQALKPALKTGLEYDDKAYKVLESFVELEISNNKNEIITIKRQIVGQIDDRLITVNTVPRLSHPQSVDFKNEYYYVRDAGAARRERGFHRYLAKFLGLDLPVVNTYLESEVPLYLECILPLFFIEQKRGWSNIQATTPTKYRIRNVSKVAIEYVLALDVPQNEKKKNEIELEKASIRSKWQSLGTTLRFYAQEVGGLLNNFPNQPLASIEESNQPFITILQDNKWVPLGFWIIDTRERLLKMKGDLGETLEGDRENGSYLEQELRRMEGELFFRQAGTAAARESYHNKENNRRLLQERLVALEEDLARNQDALRLQRYGAQIRASIAFGSCPTCHQSVVDSLLEQPNSPAPMSVEKNIDFLKQQREAAKLLHLQSERDVETARLVYEKEELATSSLRQKIQDLRTNLVRDQRVPNIALLREIISLEESLQKAEAISRNLEDRLEEVSALTAEWRGVLNLAVNLPKDFFSDLDKQKLTKLSDLFRENIVNFGFRSVNPRTIEISMDTYRPTIEGFEMTFDASASDNIRIIWAYTLAIQEVSNSFPTNHLKVSFFDEPAQQQINHESRRVFYTQIGTFGSPHQFITTTSERPEILNTFLTNVKHNLIEFGTKVLKPMP